MTPMAQPRRRRRPHRHRWQRGHGNKAQTRAIMRRADACKRDIGQMAAAGAVTGGTRNASQPESSLCLKWQYFEAELGDSAGQEGGFAGHGIFPEPPVSLGAVGCLATALLRGEADMAHRQDCREMVRSRRLELPRAMPTATSTLRVYLFRHDRVRRLLNEARAIV